MANGFNTDVVKIYKDEDDKVHEAQRHLQEAAGWGEPMKREFEAGEHRLGALSHRVHLRLTENMPEWADRSKCIDCNYSWRLAMCDWCLAPLCRFCRRSSASRGIVALGGVQCACKNTVACKQRIKHIKASGQAPDK